MEAKASLEQMTRERDPREKKRGPVLPMGTLASLCLTDLESSVPGNSKVLSISLVQYLQTVFSGLGTACPWVLASVSTGEQRKHGPAFMGLTPSREGQAKMTPKDCKSR